MAQSLRRLRSTGARGRLRQRPGPDNALGRIRFDMANDNAIRLHGTPNRSLFARDRRALSHGCIRVETPEALAASVIASPDWTQEAIETAIAAGATEEIPLSTPMPVYLFYITAAATEAGDIVYSDDIYGRDAALIAALDGPDVALARQAAAAPVRCPIEPAMP